LILTHRKDLNIGDYLVDDRLRNGAGEFQGKLIHFGTDEFPNWEVTLKYLEQNNNW
jgi:5'-nucleotidase